MKDFIFAALPWVLMGIALAICLTSLHAKTKRQTDMSKEEKEKDDDYGTIGMCMGLCIGMAVGTSFGHGPIGMSIGMLIGLAGGMTMKKEK